MLFQDAECLVEQYNAVIACPSVSAGNSAIENPLCLIQNIKVTFSVYNLPPT